MTSAALRGSRLRGIGLWSAATLVATGISFSAVALVTFSDTSADLVGPTESAVASSPLSLATTVPGTAPVAPAPASSATSKPVATTAAGRAEGTAGTTTTLPAPVTTTTVAAPPVTRPAPAAAPGPVSTTFGSAGGIATVTCERQRIRLDSARPNDGYQLDVRSGGPEQVEVRFRGDGDESRIVARCQDGMPVRAGSGPGDGRGGDRRVRGGELQPPPS
jgi:cytoskeletal protein RodZ